MILRVAIFTGPQNICVAHLWNALYSYSSGAEVLILSERHAETNVLGVDRLSGNMRISRTRHPLIPLFSQLLTFRPHLVICEGFGLTAVQAALFRFFSPQSRLLLCTTETPRSMGPHRRWLLRNIDGVLVDGPAAASSVESLPFPLARIFFSSHAHDLEAFLACRPARSEAEARRLIFVGDLTPGSGAADLLVCVVAWAEENPESNIEVWWAGDGNLAGILDAQPLPAGVSQRFLGRVEKSGLASVFAQCGILVVPALTNDCRAPVLEGLAAGLPVLGSQLNQRVARAVRDNVNGWVFDPLQPNGLAKALAVAMNVPSGALEQMRDRAQATVRPTATVGLAERFSSALAAIMPDVIQEALSESAR